MYDFRLLYPASAIAGRHRLTAGDILLLRKHMFPHGLTCPEDASQLMALHRSDTVKCPEWDNWYVETMAHYVVDGCWPTVADDDVKAERVIELVTCAGMIATTTDLEVILHSMELAGTAPDRLSSLALDQLRLAIDKEQGVYAQIRQTRRAGIAQCDIDFIYRIFRDCLQDGELQLTVREAEILHRINSLVHDRFNHPAWYDLMRSISVRTETRHQPWLRIRHGDIELELETAA